MFFDPQNFSVLPNKQDRTIAADIANDVIKQYGVVLYGRFLQDGTAMDFTTERTQTDTHACIAIGINEMRAFAPTKAYIKTKDLKSEDEISALKRLVGQLEQEVKTLRGAPRGQA